MVVLKTLGLRPCLSTASGLNPTADTYCSIFQCASLRSTSSSTTSCDLSTTSCRAEPAGAGASEPVSHSRNPGLAPGLRPCPTQVSTMNTHGQKKQQGLVRRVIVRKNVSSQFHRILVFIWRSLERNWNNLLFTVKNTHVHFLLSVTVTFTLVAKQSRFLSYTDKYVNTALSHQTLVIQCFKKREDKSYDFQLESWILFQ